MKDNIVSLLSVAATVALAGFSASPVVADQDKPAASLTASATVTATVTKIDRENRWVTLKMEDGSSLDIQAGPEVRNFDQIQVGDHVSAKREDTLAVAVVPEGQASPNATGGAAVVRAPLGAKPMGVMVETATVSGKVTDIDYPKRTVTLQGPDGNSHTLEVSPAVKRLDEVKKGDNVVFTLKTATSIEVTKPEKKSAKP
jgi:Cu/Ag efflux protein CusF